MKIYHYDENGEYHGESEANESPLEPGVYLIPARATDQAPMVPAVGNRARFDGAAWVEEAIPVPPAPPAKTLAEAKADKRIEINFRRNMDEMGGFPFMGKDFDSDQLAVSRITVAVQAAQAAVAAGAPFTIDWTAKDNSQISLTAAQLIGMPVALATHANALHMKAHGLKAQIDAATTVAKVEAVKW